MNPIKDERTGEYVSVRELAKRYNINPSTLYHRIRKHPDQFADIIKRPLTELPEYQEKLNRRWKSKTTPPVMTEEKRKEMLELAKYSMGQADQKKILCDLFPCEYQHGDWLMKELGL